MEVASAGGEQRKGGRAGDQPGRKPEEICEGHERVAEKSLDEPHRVGKAKPELPGPVDPVKKREASVSRGRLQKTARALKDTKDLGLNPVAMGSARNKQSKDMTVEKATGKPSGEAERKMGKTRPDEVRLSREARRGEAGKPSSTNRRIREFPLLERRDTAVWRG